MFRLLRQFWLGNDSLQYVLDYTDYAPVSTVSDVTLPPLPAEFIAMKFYTARSLMDTAAHREQLRHLVERLAVKHPIVTLNTNLAFDEHADYVFQHVPGVVTLDRWMTPQNNLAVQTEVIRRASLFVGTCGSVAWLAPMLGTDTLAVYSDDHLLTPHLFAARHAYRSMKAARFTPLDLAAFDELDLLTPTASSR
jgi:ADP-heptose:LPS heptosyltransferase